MIMAGEVELKDETELVGGDGRGISSPASSSRYHRTPEPADMMKIENFVIK